MAYVTTQIDLGSASEWLKQISHNWHNLNQKHYHQLSRISALASQASFCRQISGGIAICWLFSQSTSKSEFIASSTPKGELQMNQLLKAYVFISSLNSKRNCTVILQGKLLLQLNLHVRPPLLSEHLP